MRKRSAIRLTKAPSVGSAEEPAALSWRTLCSSTAQKQTFLCVCRSKVTVQLKLSRSSTQAAPLGVVSRRHGAARTAGLELLVQTSNVHMTHQRASVSADGVSSAVRRTAGFKYSFCSGELLRVFLFLCERSHQALSISSVSAAEAPRRPRRRGEMRTV